MCEHTYVACERCGEPADSGEVTYFVERYVTEHATLDSEGCEIDWMDSDYSDPADSGYHCSACGHRSSDLDREFSREECECSECDPETTIAQPEDGEKIVLLHRTNHNEHPELHPDTPAEVVELFTDRARSTIALRADRAASLYEDDWIPRDEAIIEPDPPYIPSHLQPEEAAA